MKKKFIVKYSPLFESQLNELRNAVKEKDMKFNNQLLKAIEREKDSLLNNPHHGIQIEKMKIPYLMYNNMESIICGK